MSVTEVGGGSWGDMNMAYGNTQPNLIGDGIWDMLIVPADPPGNVLANTGEIGKEKEPARQVHGFRASMSMPSSSKPKRCSLANLSGN